MGKKWIDQMRDAFAKGELVVAGWLKPNRDVYRTGCGCFLERDGKQVGMHWCRIHASAHYLFQAVIGAALVLQDVDTSDRPELRRAANEALDFCRKALKDARPNSNIEQLLRAWRGTKCPRRPRRFDPGNN